MEALGQLEPASLAQHAPALVSKLEDSDADVRHASVYVLGKLEPACCEPRSGRGPHSACARPRVMPRVLR